MNKILLVTFAAGLVFAQRPGAQRQVRLPPEIVPDLTRDIVKLAPAQYKLELTNERLRVLRARLAPGEAVPVHDAATGLFIALTEAHVRMIRPDKRMHHIDLEAGQVQWIEEDSYAAKNVSNQPVEFLFVEMKRKTTGRT